MGRPGLWRILYAAFFIAAGTMHFVVPAYYVRVMPAFLPAPGALVAVSGVAEMLGGVGLLVPAMRSAAGIGLIVLLFAVFPANVEMLRQAHDRGGAGWSEALLWIRLPVQGVLIWWAWRLSRPVGGAELARHRQRPSM